MESVKQLIAGSKILQKILAEVNMPIIAKENKGEFSTAPEGLHSAVCCDVVDQGMVTTQWGESHRIQIRWQLEDLDPKTQKPYLVMRGFRLSLHEKSSLRPLLESWRGKKFSPEDLEGFDLERLIGVNCQVQIIHTVASQGKTYANIQACVPAAKGASKLTIRDYIRVEERQHREELEANPDGEGDTEWTPF
jgi:hypothetical protein